MGKVKSAISSDVHAFTEWMARKIINHLPMSVREKKHKHKAIKDNRDPIPWTDNVRYRGNVVVHRAVGKVFLIRIEEVAGDFEDLSALPSVQDDPELQELLVA